MPTALAIGLGLVALVLVSLSIVGFSYLTRGTPLSHVRTMGSDGAPHASDPAFCDMMALHTRTTLHGGHRVEVLFNGDGTYERLWEDLRSATRSITVQMYYWKPGGVADTFRDIIVERARAGVKILFLRDAVGSSEMDSDYEKSLCDAGIHVERFRPAHWYAIHKLQHRSHIRVVVVDGRVGYTGGFGLDDKWLGNGLREGEWRDTNVRVEGAAVRQLQATFAAAWCEASGTLLTGDTYFTSEHDVEGGEPVIAGVVHAAPTIGSTVAERLLALTIAGAERTLFIANAYFVPDDDFTALLCDAAQRGVDVRILTPGEKIDVKSTWHAGHAMMEQLLGAKVRIFEYQPSMMHAKTFVVDGKWVGVGTMNFDNRSLAFNDESMLVLQDAAIGALMNERFAKDLTVARELDLATFRKRPLMDKAKEKIATSVAKLL